MGLIKLITSGRHKEDKAAQFSLQPTPRLIASQKLPKPERTSYPKTR